jgi:hypothetical protein
MTTEVSMKPKPVLDRVFHGVAGLGPLLFFAVATVEGHIRSGYDAIAEPISALALGPRGWIQEVNFVMFAVSLLAFAVVLRRQFRAGVGSLAGPAIFVIMTIGVSLAGAFTMDAPGESPTLAGRLHAVAGFLVFPWIPAVLLLMARRFRRDDHWRPFLMYTVATGVFCLVALVFFLLFVGTPDAPPRLFSEFRGLVQRVLLLPFLIWIGLVTRRAFRRTNDSSATVQPTHAARVPS